MKKISKGGKEKWRKEEKINHRRRKESEILYS